MKITVFTSITGDKDELVDEQAVGNAEWIALTDHPYKSKVWKHLKAYDKFKDPRRNSRIAKIMPHQFFDTDFSIYIDGNMSLLRPPEELIERYLKNHDMALFKHPKRDCIYDECIRCAKADLDDPEVIIEQASTYERAGYAKHKGLCECGVLIRRHTPKVRQLNEAWWAEYCRHSVRDQISFMYAANKVGIRLNVLDAPWYLSYDGLAGMRDDFIKIYPHKILNPLVNG